jgi:hypothetical protein
MSCDARLRLALRPAVVHHEIPKENQVPKKNSPTRSKKFDHPKDMASGLKIPTEVKTPKHPKKSDKK